MISRRAVLFLPLACCARGPTLPIVDPSKPPSPIWMKRAIDPSRDVVITADLRALLEDPSFGPATRRAMRAAADRSVPSVNLKEAWDGAKAAHVALLEGGGLLLVLTGVPDIDPAGLTGFDGTWQWKRAAESPPGTMEFAFIPEAGSLFVLADRTWVLGAGVAAQRARAALQEGGGHPVARMELQRPLTMIVPAARMEVVERRVRMRELRPTLDGITWLRAAATIGTTATVVVELDYDSEQSAKRASITWLEILRALSKRDGEPLAFVAAGKLAQDGNRLHWEAPIPEAILESLASAENRLF